jgi:hypothetical protein
MEKVQAAAEVVAVLSGIAITYWAYDAQLDGQISRRLAPTLRWLRAQAEGIVGAFFDGRAVIGLAQSFTRHPLPPRGPAWPYVDDR